MKIVQILILLLSLAGFNIVAVDPSLNTSPNGETRDEQEENTSLINRRHSAVEKANEYTVLRDMGKAGLIIGLGIAAIPREATLLYCSIGFLIFAVSGLIAGSPKLKKLELQREESFNQ